MSRTDPHWEEFKAEAVEHPQHYGGGLNVYEHIKVVDAWGLGYRLASCTKYICRAGKKAGADPIEDLKKARFWLDSEIQRQEAARDQRAKEMQAAADLARRGGQV